MKKIELHLHLDGSLDIDYANKIYGKDISNEMMSINDNSLSEYLDKFKIPEELLTSYDKIYNFSYLLGVSLVKEEVIYAEIRYCPTSHNKYISVDEVIRAVRDGFNSVSNLKTNIIFCMRRNYTYNENMEIIKLAKKYLGNGCAALDLVGDEANYKTSNYQDLFAYIKELNIPYTIHAGEADGYMSINSAIEFGTKRIGHGIRSIENIDTINKLIDNNILLEVCPKSNIDTKVVKSIEEHPIKKLYDMGVKVCINTDNRTVSNTNLDNEYKLIKQLGFTDKDIINMNLNAIEGAFITDKEKEELKRILIEN